MGCYDESVSDEERRARADARRATMTLRRGRLGDEEVDFSPVFGAEAIALATRLSSESWAMSGLPDPVIARRDLPVRFVRRD